MEYAQNLLSTRRGTVIVGVVAAGLALILLLAYLSQYRSSLGASTADAPVLVATTLIPKGTPGDIVASSTRFEVAQVAAKYLKEGALSDPAALNGRAAVADIAPGQQLTAADFSAPAANVLGAKLTGNERAIAVPLGGSSGLAAEIQAGDHVDVFVILELDRGGVTQPAIKLISDNVRVLRGAGQDGNIVLRARGAEAARLALAADNGKLWILLRAPAASRPTNVNMLTRDALLTQKPVTGGRP